MAQPKYFEVRSRVPLGNREWSTDYTNARFCEWALLAPQQEKAFRSMVRLNPRCYEMRPSMVKPGVWRVGLFWSSGTPGFAVRLLAEGEEEIAEYEAHKDFINWIHFSEQ